MSGDESRYLTTGEAARLLAVTPDTVLKWIHRGRVTAVLTAGGHHRIEMGEIRRLQGECGKPAADAKAEGGPVRCWEYFSEGGAIRSVCLECAAYRFRAARCYEVQEASGPACGEGRMCSGSCAACPYYLRAHRQPQRVLVVSRDAGWVSGLRAVESEEVELAFAEGVYEASALVGEFLPGSVVLDGEMPEGEVAGLREALKRDRRIPWVRVYLAGGEEAGALAREFTVEELAALVNGACVESAEG